MVRRPSYLTCLERLVGGAPGHVPFARRAAVVLRDVDVDHVALDGLDGGGQVLLLDVGMEGIEHALDRGVVDLVEIAGQLLHGVEEVAFEAVQRLEREADAVLAGIVAGGAVELDAALALLRGRSVAGEMAELQAASGRR